MEVFRRLRLHTQTQQLTPPGSGGSGGFPTSNSYHDGSGERTHRGIPRPTSNRAARVPSRTSSLSLSQYAPAQSNRPPEAGVLPLCRSLRWHCVSVGRVNGRGWSVVDTHIGPSIRAIEFQRRSGKEIHSTFGPNRPRGKTEWRIKRLARARGV